MSNRSSRVWSHLYANAQTAMMGRDNLCSVRQPLKREEKRTSEGEEGWKEREREQKDSVER